MDQNEDNKYILNEAGEQLCKWFIGSNEGKAEVTKIETFSYLSNLLTSKILHSKTILGSFILITLFAIFLSTKFEIIIIGTFLLPVPDQIPLSNLLYYNIIFYLIILLFYHALGKLVGGSNFQFSIHSLSIFIVSHFPTHIVVIFLYLLNTVIPISLGIIMWLIISVILQFLFVAITSSFHISNHGIGITRSLIISFSSLYLTLLISIYFS